MEALRTYYKIFLQDSFNEELIEEYYGKVIVVDYEKMTMKEIEELVDFVVEKIK